MQFCLVRKTVPTHCTTILKLRLRKFVFGLGSASFKIPKIMVGATIFEFCKGLFDRERLIIEGVLYIWVALTSERLVSRFFHFKLLSFTSTSTNLMSYDMINPLIIFFVFVSSITTQQFNKYITDQ